MRVSESVQEQYKSLISGYLIIFWQNDVQGLKNGSRVIYARNVCKLNSLFLSEW